MSGTHSESLLNIDSASYRRFSLATVVVYLLRTFRYMFTPYYLPIYLNYSHWSYEDGGDTKVF